MVALYVTSSQRGSGKTTICAGLGKHLEGSGKRVGFFKPVIAGNKNSPMEDTDGDAAFMKGLFALEEPVELLCPVFSNESNLTRGIKGAYAKVSRNKDVVIVEGISGESPTTLTIAETLDARVVIVEGYSRELPKTIDSYQALGKYLLGVVLNKVPRSRLEQLPGEMTDRLARAGMSILGTLPEDRALLALTIGELAEQIKGEILVGSEKSAELVENLMLGAMGVDPGPDYFGRKANKGVVVRSERPDMQLAALETSTRCLVLTGDTTPYAAVLYQAEEKKVPIISARDDMTAVVANIEEAVGNIRFSQPNKLPVLTQIMGRHFDFPAVYQGLGLAS